MSAHDAPLNFFSSASFGEHGAGYGSSSQSSLSTAEKNPSWIAEKNPSSLSARRASPQIAAMNAPAAEASVGISPPAR